MFVYSSYSTNARLRKVAKVNTLCEMRERKFEQFELLLKAFPTVQREEAANRKKG